MQRKTRGAPLSVTRSVPIGRFFLMNANLPATGTVARRELLAPFVPDDFINQRWPHGRTGGRHREHPAAQLLRVHLLSLLAPGHSLNHAYPVVTLGHRA
jgi:hypothetical protein